MRLSALAVGAGVSAEDFAGRIAEVHARAALLAVVDGRCVTLFASELGRQPRGITFDVPACFSLRTISVGAEVAARGGVLRVAGGVLTLDLRAAQPWRSGLDTLQLDFCRAPVAQAYCAAWSALDANGRGDTILRTASATLDMLDEATRRRDVAAAEHAMSALIGLGEGRTPAGDDYLVGYLAALWASGDACKSFAGALGRRLRPLAAHTEHLSRLYLEAASWGEVSERITAVVTGIAVGSDHGSIGLAVAAALAVGHSSGAAAVLGVLRGCAACAEVWHHASPKLPDRLR